MYEYHKMLLLASAASVFRKVYLWIFHLHIPFRWERKAKHDKMDWVRPIENMNLKNVTDVQPIYRVWDYTVDQILDYFLGGKYTTAFSDNSLLYICYGKS